MNCSPRKLFAVLDEAGQLADKAREVSNAADALFGHVDDTVREAVQMVVGRKLSPEEFTETCRAGLKQSFNRRTDQHRLLPLLCY